MMGVDSADIMIENETRNTYESAVAVGPMLDSMHYKAEDCLLITSAYCAARRPAIAGWSGSATLYYRLHSHPRKFTPDVLPILSY